MRDILEELKNNTYKPSISRLKKLLDNPIDFLDTSFSGNYYTRMGEAHEHYLIYDKLPDNFDVVKGTEPSPFNNDLMWSLIDSLVELMMEGGEFEESFEEAVENSAYRQSEGQVRKYFNPYKEWFLNMVESAYNGKECITEETFEVVKNMSMKYKMEDSLLPFLKGEFQKRVEFSTHGWTCKGFLDRYSEEDGIVVDFKTTKSNPHTVAARQRYDLQAAYYRDGIVDMGLNFNKVIFVISQTIPPYKPLAIVMTERDLEIGSNGGSSAILNKVSIGRGHTYELVVQDVKGYKDLLDQLTFHVEHGFDKMPQESVFKNSNIWI